ncbi:MAG: hypothetical protein K2J58_02735 [Muribaculaceae bacterium]|nr:hypothetical protein [Muribaculaceae bacterium]
MLTFPGNVKTLLERDGGFPKSIGIHLNHTLQEKGAGSTLIITVVEEIINSSGDEAVVGLVDEVLVAGMGQKEGVVCTVCGGGFRGKPIVSEEHQGGVGMLLHFGVYLCKPGVYTMSAAPEQGYDEESS